MNILVCVKQVPDTNEIKIDPVKKTLIRDGVESILNIFDAYALEQALRLKEKHKDVKIIAVSMGPPQAETMLRECLGVGADAAYLVTDRKFGGSDTYATSYILSLAVQKIAEIEGGFDLIFCGKQAIDGDTGQVGPELAEHLGLPQITYGLDINIQNEDTIRVTREVDEGKLIIDGKYPAIVTFTKTHDLRGPNMRDKMKARNAEIKELHFDDFNDVDETKIGLKGSPTRVVKTFTPEQKIDGQIFSTKESPEAFDQFIAALEETNLY